MEFYVFLPQMRMTMDAIVERSRAAEAAGFVGIAGMDHLAPPLAFSSPMYEATVTTTWIAARTERLRVGSLVLCDSFRHPAMLAREAVSIDHASGGRFDLGIGWGSVPDELATFGAGSTEARARVGRLKETLELLKALWSGKVFDYRGEYFTLEAAQQMPTPLEHIPIVIGGAGRKTMELVATHADWWNVHVGIVDRLEQMRPMAGSARVSLQTYVAFVGSEDRRPAVEELARRRFGSGPKVGSAPELVDHFGNLAAKGVERVYAWFCDFADPHTLAAFGDGVINQLG